MNFLLTTLHHFLTVNEQSGDAQLAIAAFFDIDTLSQTGGVDEEEEEELEPPPL